MILKYPYPYQSWFTIANDPDNTLIKDWKELDDFIWNKLKLPISNSLFVESFNANLPNQVNLVRHPEITSQPHDIIHTWGDYMHSREKNFDRIDALRAIEILKKNDIQPNVWIDHSRFSGNLIHNSSLGSIPSTKDASGIEYRNYKYTLDLIENLGIRYFWDGKVTSLIAQDKLYSRYQYRRVLGDTILVAAGKALLGRVTKSDTILKYLKSEYELNSQYYPVSFPDGSTHYCFRRFGTWVDADIYGLGNVLRQENIDKLLKRKGTMVVYTHLGKRPHNKMHLDYHIPEKTKCALQNISNLYNEKKLMISPLSKLLDYLVIRDNIVVIPEENKIEFKPDNIRFKQMGQSELKGHKFSFSLTGEIEINQLNILSDFGKLEYFLEEKEGIITISFN